MSWSAVHAVHCMDQDWGWPSCWLQIISMLPANPQKMQACESWLRQMAASQRRSVVGRLAWVLMAQQRVPATAAVGWQAENVYAGIEGLLQLAAWGCEACNEGMPQLKASLPVNWMLLQAPSLI